MLASSSLPLMKPAHRRRNILFRSNLCDQFLDLPFGPMRSTFEKRLAVCLGEVRVTNRDTGQVNASISEYLEKHRVLSPCLCHYRHILDEAWNFAQNAKIGCQVSKLFFCSQRRFFWNTSSLRTQQDTSCAGLPKKTEEFQATNIRQATSNHCGARLRRKS